MEVHKLVITALPRTSLAFAPHLHVPNELCGQKIGLLVIHPELADRAHYHIVMHHTLVAEGVSAGMQSHGPHKSVFALLAQQMFGVVCLVQVLEVFLFGLRLHWILSFR